MSKFSVAMIATFAVACGGGGKKDTNTMPPPPPPGDGTAATDTATKAASTTETAPKKEEPPPEPRKVLKVVTPEEMKWTPLVPEAGDKGPMVATMWGDMMSGPNGFFIKLPAGDKGMLHTHSHDYHGVAITAGSGAGQDGTKVAPVAQGTYWMQPGGVAHINTCTGKTPCIGFAHFNDGKFDFAPAKPAKGAKKDPRFVEKKLKDIKWTNFDDKNPKAGAWALAWGDNQSGPSGMLFKIPPGNAPFWHIHKSDYHAVVLQGTPQHFESGTEGKELSVGTYWWQPGGNKHVDLCTGKTDCIVYTFFEKPFDVKPAE